MVDNNMATELTDDDLMNVTGGKSENGKIVAECVANCQECKAERTFRIASGGRAYCNTCNTQIMI